MDSYNNEYRCRECDMSNNLEHKVFVCKKYRNSRARRIWEGQKFWSMYYLLNHQREIADISGWNLEIVSSKHIPSLKVFKGTIGASSRCTNNEILEVLECLNSRIGLDTCAWKVIRRIEGGHDRVVLFMTIDEEYVKRIESKSGLLPYRVGHVTLRDAKARSRHFQRLIQQICIQRKWGKKLNFSKLTSNTVRQPRTYSPFFSGQLGCNIHTRTLGKTINAKV